jgi:prepilin-type N-terminal cleavage/methylation domain-containing protein
MRRGYTLFELLLVLAVLVIVAGLAVPTLVASLEGPRLRKGGEQVRAEWAKARNQAMKTGRTQVFRCKLGRGEYQVQPWYAADDSLESSTVSTGLGGQPAPVSTSSGAVKHLPEGVVFAGGQTQSEARGAAVGAEATADWGPPILFYSDGTSSTASLSLANKRRRAVSLELRGLTGLSHVSDVHAQETTP